MRKPLNITFDTNIFDENNFDLSDNSTLSQLIQYVNQGDVTVFLSNIVIGEMKQHCQEYAGLISSKIRRNRSEIQQGILSNDKTKEYHRVSDSFVEAIGYSYILKIPDKDKAAELALNYLDKFLNSLEISILDSASVSVDDIFEDYFYKKPPFEESEKKKNEFPDAVIATQIKNNFSTDNPIFVITKDAGLKKALEDAVYCSIFSSLKELYDYISKLKEEYSNIVGIINQLLPEVTQKIQSRLEDEPDNYITLNGLDYDRKGIIGGFDYDDISYSNINLNDVSIFSLDYYDQEKISTTLRCCVTVNAICNYDDYDHAIWDSEEKDYFFLDNITNYEYHKANFACSVEINRNTEEISSLKFHIYLGGDSRISRYKESDFSQPYAICPDCGKEISHLNDGGNGFCVDCAPNH